MKTIKIAQAED